MQVLRVPAETLEGLRADLEKKGGAPKRPNSQYEAFRLEMGRFQVVGYTSGKVTLSDARLVPILEESLQAVLPPAEGVVVGSDEAGKGEWLGPMVVAACAVRPGDRARLVAHGVMDSKDLKRGAVLPVARHVEETQPHKVLLIAPPKFNDLWARFKAEGKSLNHLLAWGHATALGEVIAGLEEAGEAEGARVVVDLFDRVRTEARAARAFDTERYPVEQRARAEDEVAVAAASCLAKAARERWVDAAERRLGAPLRSLTRKAAKAHPQVEAFAKVGYLK